MNENPNQPTLELKEVLDALQLIKMGDIDEDAIIKKYAGRIITLIAEFDHISISEYEDELDGHVNLSYVSAFNFSTEYQQQQLEISNDNLPFIVRCWEKGLTIDLFNRNIKEGQLIKLQGELAGVSKVDITLHNIQRWNVYKQPIPKEKELSYDELIDKAKGYRIASVVCGIFGITFTLVFLIRPVEATVSPFESFVTACLGLMGMFFFFKKYGKYKSQAEILE